MAQKVRITLIDDLTKEDITECGETVKFSLDGSHYEIDLSEPNAAELRSALEIYISNARRVSGPSQKRARLSAVGSSGATPREIRDWARSNGVVVPDKGRIPANVREAYDQAS